MSSQLAVDPTAPSDAELIALVRGGDGHAYGQLFERHREAAMRLARQLATPADADDLVSEAFIKVLRVLNDGRGPDIAFRPYLLTAVRRLHVDRIRSTSRVTPTDEMDRFDPGVPFADPAVADFENSAAAKAFASLPERWQMVLWHLEVEGQRPAEIAPMLGMSANSVSALAYRAREGLRQAYLQMHLADTAQENCRWVTERLGAHVRGGLAKRESAKVEEHLDECPRCAAIYLELVEVNSNLKAIIAPLLLGAAAAGYLASTGGSIGLGLVGVLLGRVRDTVAGNAGASAAIAASTVLVAGVALTVATQDRDETREPVSGIVLPSSSAPAGTETPTGILPGTSPSPPLTRGTSPSAPAGPLPTSDLTLPATGNTPTLLPTTQAPTGTFDPSGTAPAGSQAPVSDTQPGGTATGSTRPSTSSAPTSASTSDPSTTQPGTTQPSTTQPGTTQPSTTQPSTTQPSTTQPSTTQPTTSTPPPGPIEADLSLTLTAEGKKGRVELSANLGGVPDDVEPTVLLELNRTSAPRVDADWHCTRTEGGGSRRRSYTCQPDELPAGSMEFQLRLQKGDAWVSARVRADVDDPNPDNDSDRYPRA